MTKRLISFSLALILLLGLAPVITPAAQAAEVRHPSYKTTAGYKGSIYDQRLKNVVLGDNQINNVLAVAASQLGYRSHKTSDKLDGSGDGQGTWNEYYITITGNFKPAEWCASFICWCFRQAGISTGIMPNAPGCGAIRNTVKHSRATWHAIDSGYKPKAGDLLLLEATETVTVNGKKKSYYYKVKRDASGLPTCSSHVALVVSDYNPKTGTYTVIEGNGSGRRVSKNTNCKLYGTGYTKTGAKINRFQGFVTPAYTTGSGNSLEGDKVDTTLTVRLTKTSDEAYQGKEFITETNACVVSKISKTAGSHISKSGLVLSRADGSVIKEHTETVTNVEDRTTIFHSWYDINKELKVKLTPATTYYYRFFAVVNGKRFEGNTYPLRTKGTPTKCEIRLNANGGQLPGAVIYRERNNVYGEMPLPIREDGYLFVGWFDEKGREITSTTYVDGPHTLTARWEVDNETGMEGPGGSAEPPDMKYLEPLYRDHAKLGINISPALTITKSESAVMTRMGFLLTDLEGNTYADVQVTDPKGLYPGETTVNHWFPLTPEQRAIVQESREGVLCPYVEVDGEEFWGDPIPYYAMYYVHTKDNLNRVNYGSYYLRWNDLYAPPNPILSFPEYDFKGFYLEDGTKIDKSSRLSICRDHTFYVAYLRKTGYQIINLDGGEFPAGSFSAAVDLISIDAVGGRLIVAAYDSADRMVGVGSQTLPYITPGSRTPTRVNVQLNNPGTASHLVAFVLSDNGAPLTNSFRV